MTDFHIRFAPESTDVTVDDFSCNDKYLAICASFNLYSEEDVYSKLLMYALPLTKDENPIWTVTMSYDYASISVGREQTILLCSENSQLLVFDNTTGKSDVIPLVPTILENFQDQRSLHLLFEDQLVMSVGHHSGVHFNTNNPQGFNQILFEQQVLHIGFCYRFRAMCCSMGTVHPYLRCFQYMMNNFEDMGKIEGISDFKMSESILVASQQSAFHVYRLETLFHGKGPPVPFHSINTENIVPTNYAVYDDIFAYSHRNEAAKDICILLDTRSPKSRVTKIESDPAENVLYDLLVTSRECMLVHRASIRYVLVMQSLQVAERLLEFYVTA